MNTANPNGRELWQMMLETDPGLTDGDSRTYWKMNAAIQAVASSIDASSDAVREVLGNYDPATDELDPGE